MLSAWMLPLSFSSLIWVIYSSSPGSTRAERRPGLPDMDNDSSNSARPEIGPIIRSRRLRSSRPQQETSREWMVPVFIVSAVEGQCQGKRAEGKG